MGPVHTLQESEMPAANSVPYLEAEALIAAMKIIDSRDQSHPLFAYFPRRGQLSTKVKVRTIKRKPGQVRHTTWGGKAVPVNRGLINELTYEPAVIKIMDTITIEDMNLYASAASAKAANDVGPAGQSVIQSANDRMMEVAVDLRADDAEEVHRLMVGALLGSISYRLDAMNADLTVDYGLQGIDSPSTLWDNVGATIVEDIEVAKRTFRDSNDSGLSANVVYYNPKIYAEYLVGNTQLQALLKLHPEYAIGLAGLPNGRTIVNGEERLVNLFGLTWVPVEGTYRNLSDAVVDRWPVNKLVLARQGVDGCQSEFTMALSQFHTPRPEPEVEIYGGGEDVKTGRIYLFDNGIPTFRRPDMVMPWTVGA